MSLNDVAVEPAVHEHRPLDVHLVAHAEQTQVRTQQRLLHGRHHIAVAVDADHGEAHAVMSHTLVDGELARKGTGERKVNVFPVVTDGHNGGKLLNDT